LEQSRRQWFGDRISVVGVGHGFLSGMRQPDSSIVA
jgi:hypothetical protein